MDNSNNNKGENINDDIASSSEEAKNMNNEQTKKQNNQLFTVIFFIALIFIAIFTGVMISKQSLKFSYAGIRFEKIKFDKLDLYYSKIPLLSITGNTIANYNLYLRNDPRTLNDIPVNANISFLDNVFVSIDESVGTCEYNSVSAMTLGTLFQVLGKQAKSAVTNETLAKQKKLNYATCEHSTNSTVIILKSSDNTEIIQESENCYVLSFKDCEVLEVTEHFIVSSLAQLKNKT